MLRAPDCHELSPGAPLTHQAYAVACARIALSLGDRPWSPVRVQVRRQGAVLCGQVLDMSNADGGAELFKVETAELGPLWASSRNVRMCQGDGHCQCAGECGQ